MTDVTRMLSLQVAKHTDANTFSNTPGTLRVVEPEEANFYPSDVERLERKLYSVDNRRYAHTPGPKKLEPRNLKYRLRGVASNDGGALVASSATEQGEMWDSHFGASATVPSGAATTVTGGNGATPNVTVTSGAGFANGDMILFATAASAPFGYVARQVISGGGTTTLVVDRPYSGTPTGTAYRCVRHSLSRSTHKHTHLYARAEGEDWRCDYFGMISESLELDMKEGDVVRCTQSWRPMDWSPQTEANPSYAAAGAGSEIVSFNGAFYIASVEFLTKSLKLSAQNVIAARGCVNGVNGVHGYEVIDKGEAVISGQIYVGDNGGSIGELVYASGTPTVKALQAPTTSPAPTFDCAIELSNGGPGQSMYIRAPALDIRGQLVDSGGLLVFDFKGYATEPSSGSPLFIGVF